MLRTIVTVIASAVLSAAAIAADTAPKEAMDFANSVASATEFEIQSSQLAQKNAKGPDVKTFADQMIADHTKAAGEFKTALQEAGIVPPRIRWASWISPAMKDFISPPPTASTAPMSRRN